MKVKLTYTYAMDSDDDIKEGEVLLNEYHHAIIKVAVPNPEYAEIWVFYLGQECSANYRPQEQTYGKSVTIDPDDFKRLKAKYKKD